MSYYELCYKFKCNHRPPNQPTENFLKVGVWWLSEWLYERSWNMRFSSLGGQRVLFTQGFIFITRTIQLFSRVQNLIWHQKYHDICLRCREQQNSLGFHSSKMMNFQLRMRSIIKCHQAQWCFMILEDTCCCYRCIFSRDSDLTTTNVCP